MSKGDLVMASCMNEESECNNDIWGEQHPSDALVQTVLYCFVLVKRYFR